MSLRLFRISSYWALVLFSTWGGSIAQSAGEAKPPETGRKEAAAPGDQGLKPVTISVINDETGKPVTHFSYTCSIETPGQQPRPQAGCSEKWTELKSPTGSFTVMAPESCEIGLAVEAPGYLGGFGRVYGSYPIKAADKERKIVFELYPGLTVRGTVRDVATEKPLAGASAAPVVFMPPLFTGDWGKAVKSDAEGRFELHGVDSSLGIEVLHPDYLGAEVSIPPAGDGKNQTLATVDVLLQAGETIRGKVVDPSGKPLEGVEISDGARKTVRTDQNGVFVLKSPKKWWGGNDAYALEFTKPGYVGQYLHPSKAEPEGMTVVLRRPWTLSGRMVSPEGRPVRKFTVIAGPGANPADYRCESAEVDDPQGQWSLPAEELGKYWVAVRAEGFAVWEGLTEVGEKPSPLTIQLERGAAVTARFTGQGVKEKLTFALVPQRRKAGEWANETSAAVKFGTLEGNLGLDGALRIDHVRPGTYCLRVSDEHLARFECLVVVPPEGIGLGTHEIPAPGRTVGRIHIPDEPGGKVWAFADGHVSTEANYRPSISFKADEQGKFVIDRVPVGRLSIGFNYMISSDIIGTYIRYVQVLPGGETEVRFFDPKGSWRLPVQFVLGDGSQAAFRSGTGIGAKRRVENVTSRDPMLRVALEPKPGQAVSWPETDWEDLDGKNPQIVLPDVHPGRYRLRVDDWQGSTGLRLNLYETDVDVQPGGPPIRIPLGGSSITGLVPRKAEERAMVLVAAAPEDGSRATRGAHTDWAGNFCLRYLEPGKYTLFAYDDERGWARLDGVALGRHEVFDVTFGPLVRGGTIIGKVVLRSTNRAPDRLRATDSRGVAVEVYGFEGVDGEEFAIGNLWPGEWTVTLPGGDNVLATAKVRLQGTETVRCELVTRPEGKTAGDNQALCPPKSEPMNEASVEEDRAVAALEQLGVLLARGVKGAVGADVSFRPHFAHKKIPKEAWTHLKALPDVWRLDLAGTAADDADMIEVGQLKTLEVLSLANTPITGAGLSHLRGLSRLDNLMLRGTPITDAALAHLTSLERLDRLYLADTRITDAGMAHLKKLKQLSILELSGTRITDAAIEELDGHLRLSHLMIARTAITDASLKHVRHIVHYQLYADHTAISDAGLVHLDGLQLDWISLDGTQVSEKGKKRLEETKALVPFQDSAEGP